MSFLKVLGYSSPIQFMEELSSNKAMAILMGKTQLYKIAKLCAKDHGAATAMNIQNFQIENKRHLYKIAKICAKQDSRAIADNFKNFALENNAHVFKIAKICAQHRGSYTAEKIKIYRIKDKSQLSELALICAEYDTLGTARFIENFEIEDKTYLYEIAKLIAPKDGFAVSKNIKNFGIENKTHLYEIAKLCAQENGEQTAENIKNFGIEDPKQLLEIAKLCAHQNGGGTAHCIENFCIIDKMHLYEMAKLCAERGGGGTVHNIVKFDLDKTQFLEIVKICAERDGGTVAALIQDLGINDKTQLFEIAKICAKSDGWGTTYYIKNFGIEDNEQLFEIAKLSAQQHGMGTAARIHNYGIKNKAQLFEIAKLCAQENGSGTAMYIGGFQFEDKAQLFEIAKICAQKYGGGTAKCIYNFNLEEKEQLIEIAKICAKYNGSGTAQHFREFRIDDPEVRWELFLECFKSENKAVGYIKSFLPLPQGVGLNAILLAELLFKILDKAPEHIALREEFFIKIKSLIEELSCTNGGKEKFLKMSAKISTYEMHIQNETMSWLLKALFLSLRMPKENLNWILESELLVKLSELHEPRLRSLLTPGLFELTNRYAPRGTKGLPLIAIPFFQLQNLGAEEEKLKQIAKTLKREQNKSDILKNPVTVQTILHMVHLLASTDIFSSDEKVLAMDRIFFKQDKSIEDNIGTLLKRIAAANGLLQMQNKEWPKSLKDINEEFRASFEKLIPIDFKGVVSKRYDEIFGSSRNPYGLIIYAAGLQTLGEPEVMNCLGAYVSTVFNGTFKETRYDTDKNPHLKTIAEARPDLIEQWKQNSEKPFEISQKEEKRDFNCKEWIKTKLIDDRHLGQTKIPFIENYFKANTTEEKELVSKNLAEELQKAPSEILKLQQACIAFAESSSENFILPLKEIQAYVDPSAEFANDVKGMLQPKRKCTELKIVNTDDPVDLLLCGTDVGGSCQRLGGDPKLNKGLLGYLMDGKNRLLAIKDAKGKIIIRCILRLMWDEERPVLYRERYYQDHHDSRLINALNQAAVELAKALNVPLTSADKGIPYGKPLHALGSPVPYEYSDAARGIKKAGAYTIINANTIKEGEV